VKSNKTPAWQNKKFLIVSSILTLSITCLIFYWNSKKKSLVKSGLEEIVDKKSKGLYKIKYNDLQLDEIAGSLSISGIQILADSTALQSLKGTKEYPSIIFNVYIPKLNVLGVSTPKALLGKEIFASRLEIVNPRIELVYTGSGNDSALHIPSNEVYKQVLGNFQRIALNQIEIINGSLVGRKQKSLDSVFVFDGLSLRLNHFSIGDTTDSNSSKILFSNSLKADIRTISWRHGNGLYRYAVEGISANSDSAKVELAEFSIQPLLSEAAFMNKVNTQIDRIDLRLEKIKLDNLRFNELLQESLKADSLVVDNANVHVYKDMARPRDAINRVGNFPHQLLLRIPFKIQIDSAAIRNGYVAYKQFTPKTKQKAKLFFTRVNTIIRNITNDSASIAKNRICKADVNCLFLDKVGLKSSFSFDLAAANGRFSIDAQLAGFKATILNKIAEPLAAAKIEKGQVKKATIEINGSEYLGRARLALEYDQLKIAVMEKQRQSKTLSKKPLASFAANTIIKNSNPAGNGELRITTGEFNRDTNRGFFNLVWRSLYVAIAETMGLPTKRNKN